MLQPAYPNGAYSSNSFDAMSNNKRTMIFTENSLTKVEYWAGCAIAFGVGYLVLSHVTFPVAVSWLIIGAGALVRVVARFRLERTGNNESQQ